jgi:hypothetical protein
MVCSPSLIYFQPNGGAMAFPLLEISSQNSHPFSTGSVIGGIPLKISSVFALAVI